MFTYNLFLVNRQYFCILFTVVFNINPAPFLILSHLNLEWQDNYLDYTYFVMWFIVNCTDQNNILFRKI